MKQKIIDSYNNIHSYAKVGRLFNLSRQRVHQIVKNYHNTGRGNYRLKKIKKLYENLGKCKDCNKKATLLHHNDFNNNNDCENNLIPICNTCHINRHKKHNEEKFKNEKCIVCGDVLIAKFRFNSKLCKSCHQHEYFHKKNLKAKKVIRRKFYPKNCIVCGINTIGKKRYHGKCQKCFAKEINNKPKIIEYRKKYNKKRWENNKEYLNEVNKQCYVRRMLNLL